MRSFVFNGYDFGALARAKVVGESALRVSPETARVPGRVGEAVLDMGIPFKVVRLNLFLELERKVDSNARTLSAGVCTRHFWRPPQASVTARITSFTAMRSAA